MTKTRHSRAREDRKAPAGAGSVSPPNETVRFGVSLPLSLLQELDGKVIAQGRASRSEFIRDLIRERLIREKWAGDEDVVGVLTIVYDHHQRELPSRITEAQHSHYLHTVCTTHVHLDHDACLEVIIIHGKPSDIERLSTQLGGLRGVKFSKLTRTSRVET
ncbi:nickel-responsive transcriptional regulator NikR [Candidatus Fermentibacteria bacterium]|nr:nickel-responsive transcriptional regulator NikR [Candidatus Fermentibacteria bacterium]